MPEHRIKDTNLTRWNIYLKEIAIKWEYLIIYVYSETLGGGQWQWVVNFGNRKYAHTSEIMQLMNELGRNGWELVSAMSINWSGGETNAFQMFFKRSIS